MGKKTNKGSTKKAAVKQTSRTLYVAAGATGYIVHPGRPLPPDLQKIVDARAQVIAEDMVAEAKSKGVIYYLSAKKTAYNIKPGEPLPPALQEEVIERASKLADEIVQQKEKQRQNATMNQVGPTATELGRGLAEQLRCWSPAQQNLIMAIIVQRLTGERKAELHQMERMQVDAGDQVALIKKSVADLEKIATGEFLILH
jgi:hypothetical protein